MITIISTIAPIFIIIGLGWIFHRKGFIPSSFIGPANSLVYHLAIPAMVFNAISKASLTTHFDVTILAITLLCPIFTCFAAWILARVYRFKNGELGTFVQTSFHGNLAYIGLAVSYYYMGEEGFVRASIIMGFLLILQNLMSVLVLSIASSNGSQKQSPGICLKTILGNPILMSAMAGIFFSLLKIPIPLVIDRSLGILSSMALPIALLIIGATLSFDVIRLKLRPLLSSTAFKLILMPAMAVGLFALIDIGSHDYLPAMILLASPTATISYVLAKEMKGDPYLANAVISGGTLLSAFTYSFWLLLLN